MIDYEFIEHQLYNVYLKGDYNNSTIHPNLKFIDALYNYDLEDNYDLKTYRFATNTGQEFHITGDIILRVEKVESLDLLRRESDKEYLASAPIYKVGETWWVKVGGIQMNLLEATIEEIDHNIVRLSIWNSAMFKLSDIEFVKRINKAPFTSADSRLSEINLQLYNNKGEVK